MGWACCAASGQDRRRGGKGPAVLLAGGTGNGTAALLAQGGGPTFCASNVTNEAQALSAWDQQVSDYYTTSGLPASDPADG